MADETVQQIEALIGTYRLLIAEGDMTRAQLKAKIIAAQAVVEDGAEIIAVGDEGSTTESVIRYPKQVVIAAALKVWDETHPTAPTPQDQSAVHMDFSRSRIET